MTRDIRNVHRGQCQACGDCGAFISVSGRVLCDYCGCPPAQHENLEKDQNKKSHNKTESEITEVSVSSIEKDLALEILELEDEDDSETSDEGISQLDSSEDSINTSKSSQKSGYYYIEIGL